ncbi:PH domain-containing protein [Rummeliibacillus sp. POC4]|uniref:PH domain-containing protein n=1 Tax=Rummeliibacillus sp. POC4 TaxID=2305899 RepID=UPI000E672CAF|nr:PH domain-containing protein [Rummeliibacillus sp. POC4]RIJ65499.1 hypothetical protein D1606_07975 [Rummeliibacillus sp. POC4]
MQITYDDVSKRFKECKVTGLLGMKQEMKELAKLLYPNEIINYAICGPINKLNYLITSTDKRLIFIHRGFLKSDVFYYPLSEIIFPVVDSGLLLAKISFTHKGKRIEIKNINKVSAEIFVESLIQKTLTEQPVTEVEISHKTISRKTITFNVAGVTKENDQGKDIQKLLQQEGKQYCKENEIDLYNGLTNKEIIEFGDGTSEFEDLYLSDEEVIFIPEPTNPYDENAIKVFLKYGENESPTHIGYVPINKTKELQLILDTKNVSLIDAHYVGGKIKELEYDYETDKDKVVVKELTLGIEISITYTN